MRCRGAGYGIREGSSVRLVEVPDCTGVQLSAALLCPLVLALQPGSSRGNLPAFVPVWLESRDLRSSVRPKATSSFRCHIVNVDMTSTGYSVSTLWCDALSSGKEKGSRDWATGLRGVGLLFWVVPVFRRRHSRVEPSRIYDGPRKGCFVIIFGQIRY